MEFIIPNVISIFISWIYLSACVCINNTNSAFSCFIELWFQFITLSLEGERLGVKPALLFTIVYLTYKSLCVGSWSDLLQRHTSFRTHRPIRTALICILESFKWSIFQSCLSIYPLLVTLPITYLINIILNKQLNLEQFFINCTLFKILW